MNQPQTGALSADSAWLRALMGSLLRIISYDFDRRIGRIEEGLGDLFHLLHGLCSFRTTIG